LLAQIFQCALGIIPFSVKETVPKKHMWKVILNSRIHILFYSTVIVVSIVYQTILPVLFFLLPYYYGNTLLFLTGYTQHAGLAFNVKDPRINTRTVILNPILSWLYCKMGYHMEHHMFPTIPWYNLPKLHEHIKSQLPKPSKGLFNAYREIIPAVHRQAIDPSYVPKRECPI
jgi:fatty acid desaturase